MPSPASSFRAESGLATWACWRSSVLAGRRGSAGGAWLSGGGRALLHLRRPVSAPREQTPPGVRWDLPIRHQPQSGSGSDATDYPGAGHVGAARLLGERPGQTTDARWSGMWPSAELLSRYRIGMRGHIRCSRRAPALHFEPAVWSVVANKQMVWLYCSGGRL